MSTANQPTQKPRLNVYTMMLLLSFIALLVGTILLVMELSKYGEFLDWWNTQGTQPVQAMIAPLLSGFLPLG